MRRLFAGIAFLSRIPVPGATTFDAVDVGRATLAFPLVGAVLRGLLVLARQVLYPALPPLVAAFLLLALLERGGAVGLGAAGAAPAVRTPLGRPGVGHHGPCGMDGAGGGDVAGARPGIGVVGGRGGVVLAGVTAVSALQGAWCMKRIGGITGDTMGANTESCEVLVFVVLLGLGGW